MIKFSVKKAVCVTLMACHPKAKTIKELPNPQKRL